jgi:hypothetical protein
MKTQQKKGRRKVYKVKLLPCMCYVAPKDKAKLRNFEESLKQRHLLPVKES